MKLSESNGISFELTITGYEFPDIENEHYDANWLNIQTTVTHPLGSWSAEDPCLLTFEVESFIRWLEEVASGHASHERNCDFTEPCLEFSIVYSHDGEQMLRVKLSHEMAPPWLLPGHQTIKGFFIDFRLSKLDLFAATHSLHTQLAQYPHRSMRWLDFMRTIKKEVNP